MFGKKGYICNDCGVEFDEFDTTEWLNDEDEEDDNGEYPCCPFCGSDNIEVQ